MSLRYEQHRALAYTRDLLYDLIDPRRSPRIPRVIRRRASACLRHYPYLDESGKPVFSRDSVSPPGGDK